jgi:hypothetical protein
MFIFFKYYGGKCSSVDRFVSIENKGEYSNVSETIDPFLKTKESVDEFDIKLYYSDVKVTTSYPQKVDLQINYMKRHPRRHLTTY